MDGMMEEYLFVGGPKDGARIATNGAQVVVVPVMPPLDYFPKVVKFRRSRIPEPTFTEETYQRFGHVYWWEGLVSDAWCDMPVSYEIMADSGRVVRRVIREQMRRSLEELAEGKGLGRIVWRITLDPHGHMWNVKALVGPRAVDRGLQLRSERRNGISVAVS